MLFQPPISASSSSAFSIQSMSSPILPEKSQASSRILYDIPCKVCTDHSSGKHYGIFACDGCAGFFKRSIRRNRQYVCKAKNEGTCLVDKTHRNQCRACRLKRCAEVGMNKDAVQHERGPRNSTLRRQMSLYFKDHHHPQPSLMSPPSCTPRRSVKEETTTVIPPFSESSLSPPPPPLVATSSKSDPRYLHHRHLTMSDDSSIRQPRYPLFLPPPGLTLGTAGRLPLPPLPISSTLAAAATTTPTTSVSASLVAPTPKYPHEVSPPSPASSLPFLLPPPSPLANLLPQNFTSTTSLPFLPTHTGLALAAAATLRQISSESLSETAARLLFMNVRWAQQVPAFTSLPYRDQLLLLEESWRELFILSAAQFALPVEMAALQQVSSTNTPDDNLSMLSELKNLQEAIGKFQGMNVDPTEFACLRAVVLLKTCVEYNKEDDYKELRDVAGVTALQDQAQITLSKYISGAYPTQPSRFGKLLLLLPSLRTVSGRAIEELFFKKTIGAIPIERIICDMYKAGSVV